MDEGCCKPASNCPGGAYCDFCRQREKGGFRKIREEKDGVTIYSYTDDDLKESKNVIEKELKALKDLIPAALDATGKQVENIFIIIRNNNDKEDKKVAESLQQLDINNVSCARCRHFMTRARMLLENVSVEKKETKAICDLCKLRRQSLAPCEPCQRALDKFKAKKQTEMTVPKAKPDDNIIKDIEVKYADDLQTKHELKSTSVSKFTPYHSGLPSDAVFGLGTTGIVRRSHSEESLFTSFSAITEEVFKKNFKYFFPHKTKQKEALEGKTSQELIKNIRDKAEAENEEKARKEQEALDKKRIAAEYDKKTGKEVQKTASRMEREDGTQKKKESGEKDSRQMDEREKKKRGQKGSEKEEKDRKHEELGGDKKRLEKDEKGQKTEDEDKEKHKPKETEGKKRKGEEKLDEKTKEKYEQKGKESIKAKGEKSSKGEGKETEKGGKMKNEKEEKKGREKGEGEKKGKESGKEERKTELDVGQSKDKKSAMKESKPETEKDMRPGKSPGKGKGDDAAKQLNDVLKKQEKQKSQEPQAKKELTKQINFKTMTAEKDAGDINADRDGPTKLIDVRAEKLKKIAEENEGKKGKKGSEKGQKEVSIKGKEGDDEGNKGKKGSEKGKKDVSMKDVQVKESGNDLILQMVKMRSERPPKVVIPPPSPPLPVVRTKRVVRKKPSVCSFRSDLELDAESLLRQKMKRKKSKEPEVVFGEKIIFQKHIPPEPPKLKPSLFQSDDTQFIYKESRPISEDDVQKSSDIKSPFRYTLSDRKFIDNGWTVLPIEKIVRKVNVYRVTPAHPHHNWFEHNQHKLPMLYDSGERMADVSDDRGRWYYKNGKVALDFYDAEETNTQQRIVVYSSGCPDKRGRALPVTVLGMFDYAGNGVVFDHQGKIRLKYNQNEGVILDRELGPISHWLWHSLNEPPELKQVMIDTQLNYKDPGIYALNGDEPRYNRSDDEQMIAIEFENFIKEKSTSTNEHHFQPHQINMKALKINDQFSLRVLDQKNIYLLFRDGLNYMKLNLGMALDHKEIVETAMTEIGEVSITMEKQPAVSKSVENLQRSLQNARRLNRVRVERDLQMMPRSPAASVKEMTAALSKPLHPPPIMAADHQAYNTRSYMVQPTANSLYPNTRLI